MIELYVKEVWHILLELSFPLIAGLGIAGLVHTFVKADFIHRNFGAHGLKSIFKASLVGVPMPLCSCGVIPAAIGLKQDGASNGAATGFLISTPQTGVDSILVSATFLGWPFAIFKLISAFITGIIGGGIVDVFDKNNGRIEKSSHSKKLAVQRHSFKEAANFTIFELLGMIYRWLVIGILLAALITLAVPAGYLSTISWIGGIGGLFLMLLISLPLYVCATASVPIAASLIIAGMPPGAAMVLLMAGPASNVATIGAIFKAFGGRILAIYLATVAVFSLIFGWLFDSLISSGGNAIMQNHQPGGWFDTVFAIILVGLLAYLAYNDLKIKYADKVARKNTATSASGEEADSMIKLSVKGMTCQHCVANVTQALRNTAGVRAVKVSLADGLAFVDGVVDTDNLIQSVKKAGYEATAL